jgi:GNAT superfamily N-acetyltransferase
VDGALVAAQAARFSALDSLLPAPGPRPPDQGERLDVATADGSTVSAVLHRHRFPPGCIELLWSAAEVWQLFPFPGPSGTEGMDVLLRAWRARLDGVRPGPDSACTVTWPSRDAAATRALLDHGFVPGTVLATRTTSPGASAPLAGTSIRRAGAADLDAVLGLSVQAFDHTTPAVARMRPDPAELIAPALRDKLAAHGPVWLAERAGAAVGVADCALVESAPGSAAADLLPPGRWGYVNHVVTYPSARGTGVGRALMSVVHEELARAGTTGTYLYYNPPNPLASVFWHRQCYRPLWTLWELRPASALR